MSSDLDSIDRGSSGESRVGYREIAEQAKLRWRETRSPNAADLLAQHDSLRQNRSLALELAYEDYCIRIDNGESVDASAFCQRFPWLRRSLSRQIEVDRYIRAHRLLGDGSDIKWPQPGDPLLGFRVVEEIGAGTFSRAYLCAQSEVGDRQVVVKVAYQGAFEADTMGRLSHPNIMSVHSVERDVQTQLSCLCMPFCGRSTLCDVIDLAFADQKQPDGSAVILAAARSRCRRNDRYQPVVSRMTVRPGSSYVTGVLQLAVQIADALEHAHDRGVLHGDLKPSNVVLSIEGTPLVVDFNLSLGPGAVEFMAGGTFPYMAPEKVRTLLVGPDESDRPDGRSDIFSLGAMLYELLTGRIPFLDQVDSEEAMAPGTRMLALQRQGLPNPRLLNPAVDRRLAAFIHHCVAFEPGDRPESMAKVGSALRHHLSTSRQSYRFLRKHRRVFLLTTLLSAGGLIGGAAYRAAGPTARERQYQAAVQQYQRSEYAAAIQSFTRSLEEDAEFLPAHFGRACARLQLHARGDQPDMLQAVRHDLIAASSIKPHHKGVKVAWSVYYLQAGEFQMAVNAMEWLLSAGYETAELRNNLGLGYSKQPPYHLADADYAEELQRKADTNFRRAIQLDPQLWQAHLNLAIHELGRYRASKGEYIPHDGLKSIRLVIREDPTDTAYFFGAKLAGVVAANENDPAMLNECLDYLEQAQKRGYDLSWLADRHPFTALLNRPRFVELLNLSPVSRRPSPAIRIVMPSPMQFLP